MLIPIAWSKNFFYWTWHTPCQYVTFSQVYHCAVGWFRLTENMLCTVVLVVLTVGTVGTYTGAVLPRRPWPVARSSSLLYRELNRGMLASGDCEVTTDTCKHAHHVITIKIMSIKILSFMFFPSFCFMVIGDGSKIKYSEKMVANIPWK